MSNPNHGRLERAVKHYAETKALEEAADQFGIAVGDLREALESRGISIRVRRKPHRLRSAAFDFRVVRLTREGRTATEIAEELGCCPDTVQRVRRAKRVPGFLSGNTSAPGRRTVQRDHLGNVIEKWCSRCETYVPREGYASNAAATYGLQSYCKACSSAIRKAKRESKRQSA
jgi:transposase